jgi:hypothetical protein
MPAGNLGERGSSDPDFTVDCAELSTCARQLTAQVYRSVAAAIAVRGALGVEGCRARWADAVGPRLVVAALGHLHHYAAHLLGL